MNGTPASFKKLRSFLKERRRDLKIFVEETKEKEVVPGGGGVFGGLDADMAEDDEEEEEEATILGEECDPANSDDEEMFDDALEGDDSDDDWEYQPCGLLCQSGAILNFGVNFIWKLKFCNLCSKV